MIQRDRRVERHAERLRIAGLRIDFQHRGDGFVGRFDRAFDRLHRRAHEALHQVRILRDQVLAGDDAGVDRVDAVVGKQDRAHRLAGLLFDDRLLIVDVAEQEIGLAVDDRIALRRRVARELLDLRCLDLVDLEEHRPQLRQRIARRHRDSLADDVGWLHDVLVGKSHDRLRTLLQQHADGLGRCALRRRLHHRADVGVAELRRACRDGLDGDARAAAFLDLEIDAFGLIQTLVDAVIGRRVLTVVVPVEHQDHLVARLRLRESTRKHRDRYRDCDSFYPAHLFSLSAL